MCQNKITFRAVLDGEKYCYIGFHKSNLFLRANLRRARCGKCGAVIEPAEGVKFTKFRESCFICLSCARGLILEWGPRGYIANPFFNLQACSLSLGKYTAEQVAESIQKFEYYVNSNGIDVLTPMESVSI